MQVSRGTWLRLAAQLSAALLSIVRGGAGGALHFFDVKKSRFAGASMRDPNF